jgi:hypothetical protein
MVPSRALEAYAAPLAIGENNFKLPILSLIEDIEDADDFLRCAADANTAGLKSICLAIQNGCSPRNLEEYLEERSGLNPWFKNDMELHGISALITP